MLRVTGGQSEAKASAYKRADVLYSVIGNHPFGNLATRCGYETAVGPWLCVPVSRRVCRVEDVERGIRPSPSWCPIASQAVGCTSCGHLKTTSLSRGSSCSVDLNQQWLGPHSDRVDHVVCAGACNVPGGLGPPRELIPILFISLRRRLGATVRVPHRSAAGCRDRGGRSAQSGSDT